MTQHRIFKLLKVLAENGAEEVAPNSHTPLPQNPAKKQSRLLTYNELGTAKGIGYSRIQLNRLEEEDKFPKRIKIGARVYWYEHEIDEYVLRHADARRRKIA